MSDDKMREAFEKHYAKKISAEESDIAVLRRGAGYSLTSSYLQTMWEGWQAAWQASRNAQSEGEPGDIATFLREPFELNMSNYDSSNVEQLQDWALRAYDIITVLSTPAPVKPAKSGEDTIERSKRVLAAVDDYHECPSNDTRHALRSLLLDEFAASHAPIGAGDAEQWESIETAPKGANGFAWMDLAWGADHDRSTGKGFRWGDRYFVAATFYCPGNAKQFEFREIEVNPTHWVKERVHPEDADLLAKRGGA